MDPSHKPSPTKSTKTSRQGRPAHHGRRTPFVGTDDPDSPQWNVAALGPEKRKIAESLIVGLRQKMSPGAMLHFGQGKWYPGEPLPRWALALRLARSMASLSGKT